MLQTAVNNLRVMGSEHRARFAQYLLGVSKDKWEELIKTLKEDPEIIGGYR